MTLFVTTPTHGQRRDEPDEKPGSACTVVVGERAWTLMVWWSTLTIGTGGGSIMRARTAWMPAPADEWHQCGRQGGTELIYFLPLFGQRSKRGPPRGLAATDEFR